jgi:D-3-phosphoglycerate dehydrogenase
MRMRVLLTTTSFQDTPGPHHDLLGSRGYEIIRERGPLTEARMLELMGEVDGLLCGDDGITRAVLEKALPRLKVVSKYGIGLDKIDLQAATELKIPVCFTPGVNHHTVAEHTFMLLLALQKNLIPSVDATRNGQWTRTTGHELHGKTIGIIGLGRIGQEVATRARVFGLSVIGFGNYWDDVFAKLHNLKRAATLDQLLGASDYINCARGELVQTRDLIDGLKSGRIAGYGADVLELEPPPPDYPLLRMPNCIITPHLGSRTHENVVRQATMSVENLMAVLDGKPPLAQENKI